jgi:hypothetical protein
MSPWRDRHRGARLPPTVPRYLQCHAEFLSPWTFIHAAACTFRSELLFIVTQGANGLAGAAAALLLSGAVAQPAMASSPMELFQVDDIWCHV